MFNKIVQDEIDTFVPISRVTASVENRQSSPSWSQVGGLYTAKEQLTATILRPSLYRRIYDSSQVRLPRGILLFGPAGCGKTYMVPALAKECGFRLITCRGPELLDKYIGASEANVRELFARAAAVAPSILLLDELDALAPRRGSDHTGVTDRIVNQLLTFLDGVEDFSQRIYIIAATSRPDKVDPALLRPGRLEKHIYVGCSETVEEASDVLSKIALRYKIDEEALDQIRSGQFLGQLMDQSSFNLRMSPADMKGVCNTAQVIAVREALREGRTDDIEISAMHLREAFSSSRPSLASDEYYRLQSLYASYRKIDTSSSQSNSPVDISNWTRADVESEPLRTALR
jgi:SpoVK/Ycf46/Vps4 family AAA+-type ATPase